MKRLEQLAGFDAKRGREILGRVELLPVAFGDERAQRVAKLFECVAALMKPIASGGASTAGFGTTADAGGGSLISMRKSDGNSPATWTSTKL